MRTATILLFAAVLPAFSGQSLVVTPAASGTLADPNPGDSASWRFEFQIHDWATSPPGARPIRQFGIGVELDIGVGSFEIYDRRDNVPGFCSLPFPAGYTNVTIRVLRNAATSLLSCELWTFDGSIHEEDQFTITWPLSFGAWLNTGGFIGDGLTTASFGFIREFSTLVPINSTPPETAAHGDWLELTFDGTLADAGTAGRHSNLALSFPFYISTPDQAAFSLIKTSNAPSWSNQVALRAGAPAALDGSNSFTMIDGSTALTYFWQELSGPSTVSWSSRTVSHPTISGLVFGDYLVQLQVTDSSGNVSLSNLHVGAVAMDSNGIVVQGDAPSDSIFGPMIAFGQNPWAFADERAYTGMTLRKAVYETTEPYNPYSWASPPWDNPQPGTVTYTWNGVGAAYGGSGTTITSPLTATSMSISVANAAALDLSVLPTRIMLSVPGYSPAFEEVRICSVAGNVLTVCYDGRGAGNASPAGTSISTAILPATAWPSGSTAGQQQIKGVGTAFGQYMCPGGMPGQVGPVVYNTGTVSVTPGSVSITGAGTAWVASGVTVGVNLGDAVQVSATHSGTPFVFIAYISVVNGTTSITLNRPFPSDADPASGLSYKIVKAWYREVDLHFARPDPTASDAHADFGATGCESNTQMFFNAAWRGHGGVMDGTTQSAKQWSFLDTDGYIEAGGPGSASFYGECLANMALWKRSGLAAAKQAAEEICNHWVHYPMLGGEVGGGFPGDVLTLGGAQLEAIASLAVDPDVRIAWTDVRGFISNAAATALIQTCIDYDTRETGYQLAWLTLGALYDPDTSPGGYRSQWRTGLQHFYVRDGICKGPDDSWSNNFDYAPGGSPVVTTHGSATITAQAGHTIDPPGCSGHSCVCQGVDTGTVMVTKGSSSIRAISGSFGTSAQGIAMTGTVGGVPFSGYYTFTYTDFVDGTISVLWPGDTGTATYMTTDPVDAAAFVIGFAASDPDIQYQHVCKTISATTAALDRPWEGSTTSATDAIYKDLNSFSMTVGRGQQPFMLGIDTYGMNLASSLDSTLGNDYALYRNDAAGWIKNTAWQTDTHSISYAVFQFSNTPVIGSGVLPAGPGTQDWKSINLIYGDTEVGIQQSRALNAEVQSAGRAYYLSQGGSSASVLWGDDLYSSTWGNCNMTAPGYECDPFYVVDETNNNSLGQGGKWLGFFFGMGMAHQWPAVRLGGVAPAANRTLHVGFNLAGIAGASSVVITATAPSGAKTVTACTSSPCSVIADARQGTYLVQLQYLSAGNQLLALGGPMQMVVQ